ncbi:MAG: hypothetical protein LBK94_06470 [Prevotellaceae bacterium]|nr:hypothetical protein [Prevotellaceae bacterium]
MEDTWQKSLLLRDLKTVSDLLHIAVEYANETQKQGYKLSLLGDEYTKTEGLISRATTVINNLLFIYANIDEVDFINTKNSD